MTDEEKEHLKEILKHYKFGEGGITRISEKTALEKELEALRARLTATEAALSAARELMEMSVPLCTTRLCRNHGDIILHVRDCEYTDKKKVYYAVLARLQEMTE